MVRGKTGECCLGVLPLKNCCSASFSLTIKKLLQCLIFPKNIHWIRSGSPEFLLVLLILNQLL